jgi:carbamoyl-phosphate synthase small subunit
MSEQQRRAILALADGTVFEGRALGVGAEVVAEVVFNTAHTGYQEILTDPSYAGQLVTLTYPEIGNYGVNADDVESDRPHAAGLVVREACKDPSSWRSEGDLDDYLKRHGLPGIEGIDTRMLVRRIRDAGAQMAVLSTLGGDPAALVERARSAPGMEGRDLASGVSCEAPYVWDRDAALPSVDGEGIGAAVPAGGRYRVVAYDFGIKRSILGLLHEAGCEVTVVPAHTPVEEVLARSPEGVFLSNGPGDPAAVPGAAERTGELLGKVPVFGICLGCQILGRALGGRTFKLKFGHHGANHPVKDLASGRVEITSQNHGFAVDLEGLAEKVEVTHVNLNDGTVEGIAAPDLDAFAVQYHPEAAPGPHDSRYLFGRFVDAMARRRA